MPDLHPRVQQALLNSNLTHKVIRHADAPKPIRSPQDFADYLGYDLSRITKTLFCRSTRRDQFALAVAPMTSKVNFSVIAAALGAPRFEVADKDELQAKLGFPPHGVSPLGAADFPVFLDASLLQFPTVLVGGGATGIEIELAPADLVRLCSAQVISLAA
jgi:Cys-tRNA(Pro)/Cys-tRNA(Cys) deacylase